MKDANPRMRIQAIRASETLYKAGDRTFDADYRALADRIKDINVAIQALLTLNYLKAPNVAETVRAAQAASTARGVQEIGNQILKPPASAFGRGGRGGPPPFTPAELAVMERGEAIYKEVCFACHGDDGRGTAQPGAAPGTTMAPSLANSARVQGHRDYVIKTLLHGMDGPIDGRSYAAGVMAPMGTNRDEWVAAIASYVRNSFGNVGIVRLAGRRRAGPGGDGGSQVVLEGRRARGVAAGAARGAADVEGEREPQPRRRRSARSTSRRGRPARRSSRACGSRSSCPEPATVTELQFNSAGGGFGGGGRGRGAGARRRRRRWRRRQRRCVPAGPYPRELQGGSVDERHELDAVAEGQGTPGSTTITFAPTAGEVRPDHADCNGRGCVRVVDAAAPVIPARS